MIKLKDLKEIASDNTLFFILPEGKHWYLEDLEVYDNDINDNDIVTEFFSIQDGMVGIKLRKMYEDEIPVGKAENLIGKQFGKWTVLYRAQGDGKDTFWKCKCECGTIKSVRKQALTSGISQSCGCLHKEKMIEMKIQDITNQRFGKLTAIKPTNDKEGTSVVWECRCDCGNLCYVSVGKLNSGNTKSCGCLNSQGELLISTILNNNHIKFEQQKTFSNCRFYNTNHLARFDFYVNNSYLIEFDGQQHFKPVDYFGGEKQFQIQQDRDAYKNQWCKDNNIPLIRIPYTKLDTLCLEDLMLETTEFRIV